jgi:DNA-binding NarL/FixJ family response regulator
MALRVALVDDHQQFRERLRALLQRDPDVDIVAEAGSGHELLEIARSIDFDVVCMDIRLPGMNGIETTRRLLATRPAVRVIGLSAYAEPHYVEAMLSAGAVGHFTKGDVSEGLLQAIHTATVDRPLFGANVLAQPSAIGPLAGRGPDQLSSDAAALRPREVEVLMLIAREWTAAQIAHELSLDPSMVDVYRRNIMRKLQLGSEAELSEYARRWSSGGAPGDDAL